MLGGKSIPFNRLQLGRRYRIDHRESKCSSICSVLVSIDRQTKTYSYAYTNKTDIVYLKVFSATFRGVHDTCTVVLQEDEWAVRECADAIVFSKVVEGGDLDVVPDEIIREFGKFLLGGR